MEAAEPVPEVELYEDPAGRCPAQEFIDGLSPTDEQPFVDRKITLLEREGHRLRRPHVDYLRDDIWELRVKARTGELRFLFFYFYQESIVVSHGLRKRTDAVPRAEINRAVTRRADYFARHKRHE